MLLALLYRYFPKSFDSKYIFICEFLKRMPFGEILKKHFHIFKVLFNAIGFGFFKCLVIIYSYVYIAYHLIG
jgi:hypothetical protein